MERSQLAARRARLAILARDVACYRATLTSIERLLDKADREDGLSDRDNARLGRLNEQAQQLATRLTGHAF